MTTTPRTWVVGEVVTAAYMNTEIRDQFNSFIGAWTSWTPTWTTSTGSATPSFGDATIGAYYNAIGKTVLYRMEITFGSTTNFGTAPTTGDNWRFSLPVTAATTIAQVGTGEIVDSTSTVGSRLRVRVRSETTTTMSLETSSGRVDATALTTPYWGLVDSLSPWTWAAGDFIRLSGFYEAA